VPGAVRRAGVACGGKCCAGSARAVGAAQPWAEGGGRPGAVYDGKCGSCAARVAGVVQAWALVADCRC